jgi:acetyl esterase/lipase
VPARSGISSGKIAARAGVAAFIADYRLAPEHEVGTAEVLLDDSLRLGSEDGIEVHAWEDMLHVFPSSIGLFEAARSAHDLITAFLRAELAI